MSSLLKQLYNNYFKLYFFTKYNNKNINLKCWSGSAKATVWRLRAWKIPHNGRETLTSTSLVDADSTYDARLFKWEASDVDIIFLSSHNQKEKWAQNLIQLQ